MVAAGWSEAQKRAYVLADNKLALNAGWDNDLLKIEIGDLQAFDFDLGLIGFSADEIAGLTFDRSGLTDPDETPETTGNTGERPIENNSSPGQAVYDPFVGSGTTIIAAEVRPRLRAELGLYRRRRDALAEFYRADRNSRSDGRGF
jgi:hypothetical protein